MRVWCIVAEAVCREWVFVHVDSSSQVKRYSGAPLVLNFWSSLAVAKCKDASDLTLEGIEEEIFSKSFKHTGN